MLSDTAKRVKLNGDSEMNLLEVSCAASSNFQNLFIPFILDIRKSTMRAFK